jgi:hypothetical protein
MFVLFHEALLVDIGIRFDQAMRETANLRTFDRDADTAEKSTRPVETLRKRDCLNVKKPQSLAVFSFLHRFLPTPTGSRAARCDD